MKKIIIALTMLIVAFSFVGCEIGQVSRLPGDLLAVERAVVGNQVTLDIGMDPSLDDNEIIIIADNLPDGLTYEDGSASIAPTFSSDGVLAWLFKKPGSDDQIIGSLTVDIELPLQIGYSVQGTAASGSEFKGKWGLKLADKEGLFEGDSSGTECSIGADCQPGYDCVGGSCVPVGGNEYDFTGEGHVDGSDILFVVSNWQDGVLDGSTILGIIQNWNQG
ncbi:MAG: hypothetical protein KKC75_03230 [Nanoarchaeota archaeon]|nr:hypothetical protein [Nanoarchaeota archaeon]MBU1005428.1 hypothetical protein [Nanoarchaeota archaeon]MBU1945565.1 hypothetical protein [Nanoarchaeota archaeon]